MTSFCDVIKIPERFFGLPEQPETWIEVDENFRWQITSEHLFTRSGWTPFSGWPVQGKVCRVVLRGETVYQDGCILNKPGSGRNIRSVEEMSKESNPDEIFSK